MSQKHELLQFYQQYYNTLKTIEKSDPFVDKFYQSFLSGKNEVYQKYISETKNFDETWIKTVESYIPSLNKIVLNPTSTLKAEEEVVIIEKARKITSQSIKHLAANTHMVKEVSKKGDVIPKKILTSYIDVEYGTYENRFIMTLIDRLFTFVRSRYEVIKTNIESFEKRRLHLNSSFPINETKVDVKVDFLLTDETENKEISEFNKQILKRVEYLNKIVAGLKNSQFMTLMSEQRKIYPPIMKTNVIQKNIDFRNAYMLWLFIDRYNTLAFTVDVEEKDLTFDDKYYQDLNRQMLTLYSSVIANQQMNKEAYLNIKPKKYRKRSIRIKKTHPDDIVLTPEDEVIEDQTLNEYYLNANKKIFQQSLEYYQEESRTYETAVKRALRETLNISNALYESFFELKDEEDVFQMLITEIDVTKELQEARRKLLIAKMIREVKEVDFNNALRQEKKFLNDIAKYDGMLLRESEEKLKLLKKGAIDKALIEKDRQMAIAKRQIIDEKLKETKFLSDEIKKYRIEINKKINEYIKELERKNKKELALFNKKLAEQNRKEIAAYKKKHKPDRRVTLLQLQKEKVKINEEFKVSKAGEKKVYQEKLALGQKKLKKISSEKLEKAKQDYQKMLLENQKNVEALEVYKQEFSDKLLAYKKDLQAKEKAILTNFREELKENERVRLVQIKAQYKIEKRLTAAMLAKEKEKLEKRLKEQIKTLSAKANQNTEGKKDALRKRSEQRIKANVKFYQGLYLNNKRNLERLKKAEAGYQNALLKHTKALEEKQKLELKTFTEKLKELEEKRLNEIALKYEITNKLTDAKLRFEVMKLERSLQAQKEKIDKKIKAKQSEKKSKLLAVSQAKIIKTEKTLKVNYLKNEKNIKALKTHVNQYEKESKKLKDHG